ncbi:hypothetical protein BDV32DRAFT_127605, partial [Aspergillus pseudonomiae]
MWVKKKKRTLALGYVAFWRLESLRWDRDTNDRAEPLYRHNRRGDTFFRAAPVCDSGKKSHGPEFGTCMTQRIRDCIFGVSMFSPLPMSS